MSKKVLIINGHPDKETFNGKMVQAYQTGAAQAQATVEVIHVTDLSFDPILWKGYKQIQELEPDLKKTWKLIQWADHLVFVYPTWWGSMPALLKGFIDRVFLPGQAFSIQPNGLPLGHLKGKTARLLVSMDGPRWYYHLIAGSPGHKMMKRTILEFCGIKPVKLFEVNQLRTMSKNKRQHQLKLVEQLGTRLV